MHSATRLLLITAAALLAACTTTQQVDLAKANPARKVSTVAQVPEAGNSPEMDANLQAALLKAGLSMKAPLPAGTRSAPDVDAIVSYGDNWRWDIVMYLRSLSVKVYDAQSGDLLVTGEWRNSAMHGFQDAKAVMQGLVEEMLSKLRGATK